MREVNVKDLIPAVKKLCIDANYYMGEDVIAKIKEFKEKE